MAWITLTPANVTNGRLTAAEIAKVNSLASDATSIADLIPSVSRYVTGYIPRESPIGLDGTIPDELQEAACAIIVWRYVTQIPSTLLATEARKDAKDDAERFLRGPVARGDFRIVPPDTLAPEQPTTPSPHIELRPSRFKWRDESGA
jgi:hypothetical protein